MKSIVRKEIAIYLFLLLFLCVWMHYKELLDHPIAHFKALPQSPFGLWHPLLFTFVVYLLIAVVRGLIVLARRLQRR